MECGVVPNLTYSAHYAHFFNIQDPLLKTIWIQISRNLMTSIKLLNKLKIRSSYSVMFTVGIVIALDDMDKKDKYKEALFNVAYLKKKNVSSVELLLRHNNIFLTVTALCSIFLAQPLFM